MYDVRVFGFKVYGSVRLLLKETLSKLGVDSSEQLTPNHKVDVVCNGCGETFTREFANIHKAHNCSIHKNNRKNGPAITASGPYWVDTSAIKLLAPIRCEIKIIHKDGKIPSRSRATDCGYDLTSVDNTIVPPHSTANINTGIIVSCPPGTYYTVDGRSGMGEKGLIPFRGIIDSTYVGPLMVRLMNISDSPCEILSGHRIAQIVFHHQIDADFFNVEEFSHEYSARGTAGFGSSGM